MRNSVTNTNSPVGLRRDIILGILVGLVSVGLLILLLLLVVDSDRVGLAAGSSAGSGFGSGSGGGAAGGSQGAGNADSGNKPYTEAVPGFTVDATSPADTADSVTPAPATDTAAANSGNTQSPTPPQDPQPFALVPIPVHAPPVIPAQAEATNAGSAPVADGKSSTFLGLRAEGQSFVYLVDHSGSMQGRRFDRVREELRLSIEFLTPAQQFFVIFFSETELPMPFPSRRNAGLIAATDDNKRIVAEWIEGITLGSGTEPAEALASALRLEPDVIFLMSDGGFGDRARQTALQRNRNGRVSVHTIGFEDRGGEVMLKTIAKENRGDYRFVP